MSERAEVSFDAALMMAIHADLLVHGFDGLCGLEINSSVHSVFSPFVCKRKRPHRVFRYGISQRSFCRWSLRCHCSSSLMIVSSICFGV